MLIEITNGSRLAKTLDTEPDRMISSHTPSHAREAGYPLMAVTILQCDGNSPIRVSMCDWARKFPRERGRRAAVQPALSRSADVGFIANSVPTCQLERSFVNAGWNMTGADRDDLFIGRISERRHLVLGFRLPSIRCVAP